MDFSGTRGECESEILLEKLNGSQSLGSSSALCNNWLFQESFQSQIFIVECQKIEYSF